MQLLNYNYQHEELAAVEHHFVFEGVEAYAAYVSHNTGLFGVMTVSVLVRAIIAPFMGYGRGLDIKLGK